MKRVIIICEGPTELEFCREILQPYFLPKNIYIDSPLIKASKGGIVKWGTLKKEIQNYLHQNAIVTTLIDYYGIPDSYNYPAWIEAKEINDKYQRMDFLEQEMKNDIPDPLNQNFIPYYQLHEFEGLLFNNIETFDDLFESSEIIDRENLERDIQDHPNPELINNNPNTSPSKRLQNYIKGYQKTLYGPMIAEHITLNQIRQKCTRFNHWIAAIENS